MSFNVGLNIVEVDGRVAPSIQAAPTSVTGFIIRSQRGIPGRVIRVTNWSQFLEYFGSYVQGAYGAYAVRGFFDNGGATAYVTRVVNTTPGTASAAAITSSAGPWALPSGSTLRFNTDLSAAPLDVTFTASGATLVGLAGPFNLDDGGGNGKLLSLTVNGSQRGPYQFETADFAGGLGAATAAEVAAVLNREFPGIQAWVEAGDGLLRVRTDRRGSNASLAAGEAAATDLGFDDDGLVAGGGNVADVDTITPGEAEALIGAVLEPVGLVVTQDADSIVITHPNTGPGSTIQVDAASAPADATLGFDNAVHAGTAGDPAAAAAASFHDFGGIITVAAGYRGQQDYGTWGDDLSVEIVTNADDVALFDLLVHYDGDVVETWPGLSIDTGASSFVSAVINDEFSGSKYITITVASGAIKPPDTPATPLAGGNNGAFADAAAEANAYASAVDLYELVEIQLLCCPESYDPAIVSKALTHCQGRGDRMFAGHTPPNMEAGDIKNGYSGALRGEKVYGALYFPWIQINDPIGSRIWVPPTGHILGVYARTERERGIWKAPAGNAARLNGALDVKYHITNAVHTDLVKNASVNAVRFIPGQGIVIDSSRTLSTSTIWLYVNVRLLFNFVKSSLMGGLRWVVQEPNDQTLWNKVKYNSVTPFLMGLWRRGAFGSGAPDEVFTVKIDAENNPPASIQQGILNIEIYFYPVRPAETIVITVGQQESGASASES
jgi:phage tail sheath protein FI